MDKIIDCFNYFFSSENVLFHDYFSLPAKLSIEDGAILGSVRVGDLCAKSEVRGVEFFSDGLSFLTCSGKFIKMWNTDDFESTRFWQLDWDVLSLKITGDDDHIVVGCGNGSISIFSAWAPNGVELSIYSISHWGGVYSIALVGEDRFVSVGADQRCCLWDWTTTEKLATMAGNDTMTCVCVTTDETKAITGSKSRGMLIWNLNCGSLIGSLGKPWGPEVWSVVAFPHDNSLVASCTATASVCVWNVSTMSLVHTLESRCGAICVLKMSPQGEHLVGGGYQLDSPMRGMLQVWDIATHEVEKEMACPNVVCSIGLTVDYDHIIAGDEKGFVHKWATELTTIIPK